MRECTTTLLLAMIAFIAVNGTSAAAEGTTADQPGLVRQQMIYDDAPFPSCHASTIAESADGLVAAWFGGTNEKNPDVGIWVSRNDGRGWSTPVEVANGVQNATKRHPTWNPVLFQPSDGPLLLFYKVGPDPRTWWGELKTSKDGGKTFSDARRIPLPCVGPVKNKPIELKNGTLLCPSSSEFDNWRVQMEWTGDLGASWHTTGPLHPGTQIGAIQPTVLRYGKKLQILCRSRQKAVVQSFSNDEGRTWSKLTKTNLPNPNSGIDAVTLQDGRGLLVYNHTLRGRSPLNVAVSADGASWRPVIVLEDQPGEYSYPAVIQSADGLVHVTYTWNRKQIKHVVLEPGKLMPGAPTSSR